MADLYCALGRGAYTCSTAGHLQLTAFTASSSTPTTSKASLPMRLCDFQLSPDAATFAYGGDEVDLSVWDAERAFAGAKPSSLYPEESDASGNKRKKPSSNDLLPGEIWRAKNVGVYVYSHNST